MEIKKFILVAIVLVSCLTVLAAPKNEKIPHAVDMFISNLEKLSLLSDIQSDEAYNMHKQNIRCFAGTDNGAGGISIDSEGTFNSELYYLGLGTVASATRYCNQLYTMLYKEKELKLKHEVLYTGPVKQINEYGKGELYFYETRLKKICEYNNQTIALWQTFEVNAADGLIDKIEGYNEIPISWRRESTGNNVEKPIIQEEPKPSDSDSHEDTKAMTEQEYLRLAARYYTAKDYVAAGATYKQLTIDYPNNAEGWFRLACLVRYEKKWSKKVYNNPQKTAISFMEKAANLAVGKLKSKAENALFYWKHENYM